MTSRLRARTVTANRLQFGVLEAGSGPLALCLHGFPDSARTWRRGSARERRPRRGAETDVADDGDLRLLTGDAR